MKKFAVLIPTGFLLASPWMHKLIYKNMLLAWPNLDTGAAHLMAISGAVIAFFASLMIASDMRML